MKIPKQILIKRRYFSTFAYVFIINQSGKIRGQLVDQIGAASHVKPPQIDMD